MLPKPHLFHIRGKRVPILVDRHLVGSEFATVLDYFWREDAPWLVLQLPDGHRAAVPADWTDLAVETLPPGRDRPLLCPEALAQMTQLYGHLASRVRPKRRQKPRWPK
jgi:hypothetical protein